MTEVSEFFYQIFAALLFCAGISLMVLWSDSFSGDTDSSYKTLYETTAYINGSADNIRGDGYRIYTRDEIMAISMIYGADKIVFPQGVYDSLSGNTNELRKYLKVSRYRGKTVYLQEETVIYLIPEG